MPPGGAPLRSRARRFASCARARRPSFARRARETRLGRVHRHARAVRASGRIDDDGAWFCGATLWFNVRQLSVRGWEMVAGGRTSRCLPVPNHVLGTNCYSRISRSALPTGQPGHSSPSCSSSFRLPGRADRHLVRTRQAPPTDVGRSLNLRSEDDRSVNQVRSRTTSLAAGPGVAPALVVGMLVSSCQNR
jgi:hypothetical protein